ncbi:unnamed protein product, partial [Rotaria magnacalcarata]
KISDTGPISNNDNGESDAEEEQTSTPPPEPVSRPSPPQKRPFSPAPTVNSINNKKIKIEQSSVTNSKKKPQQSVIKNENLSKTTVNNINNKKAQLSSIKQSSAVEEKPTKTLPIKDSNQTVSSTSNSHGSAD